MRVRYAAPPVSIELATGWTAEGRVAHGVPYTAVVPPTGDAMLQFSTFRGYDARTWVERVGKTNRIRNRRVTPVCFGAFRFVGYHVRVPATDALIDGWVLHAGDFPLDASYRCPLHLRGRDDEAVVAMLESLELSPA